MNLEETLASPRSRRQHSPGFLLEALLCYLPHLCMERLASLLFVDVSLKTLPAQTGAFFRVVCPVCLAWEAVLFHESRSPVWDGRTKLVFCQLYSPLERPSCLVSCPARKSSFVVSLETWLRGPLFLFFISTEAKHRRVLSILLFLMRDRKNSFSVLCLESLLVFKLRRRTLHRSWLRAQFCIFFIKYIDFLWKPFPFQSGH